MNEDFDEQENFNILESIYESIDEISAEVFSNYQQIEEPEFRLDEFQKRVVESKNQFIRLLAPAGSGKTKTLVAKAIEILTVNYNSSILCLTFTNAAANEFRNRVSSISPSIANRIEISTLNSFGFQVLKRRYESFKIVTRNRNKGVAYKIIKDIVANNIIFRQDKIHRLYQPILELTNLTKSLGFQHTFNEDQIEQHYHLVNKTLGMGYLLQSFLSELGFWGDLYSNFSNLWFPIWTQICEELWKHKIITFEDQKYWAYRKLRLSSLGKGQYSHVFIDEFQDINVLDLSLILRIIQCTEASLIIVGDDDQCIYEWRGCSSHFIRYTDKFFKAVTNNNSFEYFSLDLNYRCPRNIIYHSQNLIKNNTQRIPKNVQPVRIDDANIRIINSPSGCIALKTVEGLVSNIFNDYPDHSVAIVARKKCQLIPIQILLQHNNIPYAIDSDIDVFNSDAFKEFLNFLCLHEVCNHKREISKNVENLLLLLDRIKKFPIKKK